MTELLGLGPVRLVIRKGGLKHLTTMKVKRTDRGVIMFTWKKPLNGNHGAGDGRANIKT